MPSHTHPRRRPQKDTGPPMTPRLDTDLHNMSLQKSSTFHSPKSASSDICDPITDACFMPKRSYTNSQALEDLVVPRDRRLADIIETIDRTFARPAPSSSSSPPSSPSSSGLTILNDRDVLPLPSFVLQHTVADISAMDVDQSPPSPIDDHHHASDSGLGSSITEGTELCMNDRERAARRTTRSSIRTSVSTSHSAITKSVSALGQSHEDSRHCLSQWAVKQIQDNIVRPILKEASLKEFHPLIKDVPRRIGSKSISNLRDLEKTLIFLAPEFSATPDSYLNFCETSIQCIRTTVDYLNDSDQRLPADRPYTNYYFLDLMEQIRKYAAIMAATRQKEAAGEELDEMDYSPDEKITLRGGLSHDGKPAELVREKNGKVIPIAEGMPEDLLDGPSKRALSVDTDDDGVRRSMARRRKSDKPGDVVHACRDCDKEFKRPCDLTKHEKTHSRPWKCPDAGCKYHEQGWPTEKERDRHVNDKHSAAPSLYKCLYPPCTYSSKRESNCKQHMEKAHGWEYVRSKSNGRKKARASETGLPQTPVTPLIATPGSAPPFMSTPQTNYVPSPTNNSPDVGQYISCQSSAYGYGETSPTFAIDGGFVYTPAMSATDYAGDYRRHSAATSGTGMTYSSTNSPAVPTSFEEAVTPEDTDFNHNISFDHSAGFDFNIPVQQPTPAQSVVHAPFADLDLGPLADFYNTTAPSAVPHLSPNGQPDLTLYSPAMDEPMQVDEAFDGTFRPSEDFTLFPDPAIGQAGGNTGANLFHDMTGNIGGQLNHFYPPTDDAYDDLYSAN